jgi:hypothetical protein
MYLTINAKGGRTQIVHHESGNGRAVTTVTTGAAELTNALNRAAEADPDHLPRLRGEQALLLAEQPAAVAAALRAEFDRYTPGTLRTWTFIGHWENDRVVVEYHLPGEVDDSAREDTGLWEQGLWAASASGRTPAEAQDRAVAEYESDRTGICSVCNGENLAVPAGQPDAAKVKPCWHCDGAGW